MSMTAEQFKKTFPMIARHCDSSGLEALLESLDTHTIKSGSYAMTDGKDSDCLFLVCDGKLVSEIENEREGVPLGTLKAGDLFGEVNLLDPGPATSSVLATQDSTLLSLSHEAFLKLDKQHPEMTGNILRMLSDTLVERCRVADRLLFSKYEYIESPEKKAPDHPNLFKWGLGILQQLHGHKGMQP
jgi:CRP-like cAMP-binding protein